MAQTHTITAEDILKVRRRRALQNRLNIAGYIVVLLLFSGFRTYDAKVAQIARDHQAAVLAKYSLCNETRRAAYLKADEDWKGQLGNGEIWLDSGKISVAQYHEIRVKAYQKWFAFESGAKRVKC